MELCREKGLLRTAIFTKEEPLQVTYGLGIEEHDKEGGDHIRISRSII